MDRLKNILIDVELGKGYERLTIRERNIINLYYLQGYKDEEIAKIYGVCQQNVNRQRKRGIAKIKIINYF
jgi:RNA polymerase sigma factor for flagellar operon FliA